MIYLQIKKKQNLTHFNMIYTMIKIIWNTKNKFLNNKYKNNNKQKNNNRK